MSKNQYYALIQLRFSNCYLKNKNTMHALVEPFKIRIFTRSDLYVVIMCA